MKLFQYVRNGDMSKVQKYIEQKGTPIDSENTDYLILRYALWKGQREITKFLLEKGCRVNLTASSSPTPLHIATEKKDVEVIKILLAKGAIAERIDHTFLSSLNLAVLMKEHEIVDLMLESLCFKYDSLSINRISSLHTAMLSDKANTVRDMFKSKQAIRITINNPMISTAEYWRSYTSYIVEESSDHGADTKTIYCKASKPLHIAVFIKNQNEVNLILEKYRILLKNNYLVNNIGLSHFHIACMKNDSYVVASFIQMGVEINNTVSETSPYWPGYSPLHFALEHHCLSTAKLLLSCNADVNLKNGEGLSPLHIAVKHNQINAVLLLLKYGANINIQDLNNRSPLHLALQFDKITIVNLILEEYEKLSYSMNPVDNTEISHFHIACMRNYTRIVEGFLNNGVNINTTIMINDEQWPGYTALHLAMEFGNKETVQLLLNYGADIHVPLPIRPGFTLLHMAVIHRCYEFIETLVKNNIDINCVEFRNLETPLHLAISDMHFDIIDTLLAFGADTNARDKYGRTPLHELCFLCIERIGRDPMTTINTEHFKNVIASFMNHGCNIDSTDRFGNTALHLAVYLPHSDDLIYLLLQYGADINIKNNNEKTPIEYSFDDSINRLILQRHIEKLKVINFYINQNNQLYSHEKYSVKCNKTDEWIKRCKDECIKMKNFKITGYTTLYNILFKSAAEMTNYVKNYNFFQIVYSSDFRNIFPIYGYLIKLKFDQAIAETPFIMSAKQSLEFLFDHKLPNACYEKILKYLTTEDIHKLSEINSLTSVNILYNTACLNTPLNFFLHAEDVELESISALENEFD